MVHVLNAQYYKAPFLNRWTHLVLRLLTKHGIPARVIDQYRRLDLKQADYLDKTIQHGITTGEAVLWDLCTGRIKPGDIIAACNGYSTMPIVLEGYQESKKYGLTVVTYWENSTNILLSPAWRDRKRYKLGRRSWWEKYTFRYSQYNLFRNGRECVSFLLGNGIKNLYGERTEVIPQPYDILLEVAQDYDCSNKQDIAVICEPVVRGTTDKLLLAYQADVKEKFELRFAIREELTTQQYYELLAKAKVVIHPNKNTYDYTSILEGLAFGCCVMVPDVSDPIFEKIIPHDFKYQVNAVAANKVIRQIRAREAFLETVELIMQTYNESVYEACRDMAHQLAQEKFDSKPFLQLLKQIQDGESTTSQHDSDTQADTGD